MTCPCSCRRLANLIGGLVVLVNDCQGLDDAIGWFSTLSILSTSFLFLLRVRAVYQKSRFITILFGSFWIVISALCIWDAVTLHASKSYHGLCQGMTQIIYCAGYIPHTKRCMYKATNINYFAIPSIVACVNDTLVFFAISYRLVSNAATGDNWRARTRSFIKGDGLYSLSRSLLQSGQLYYL